MSYRAIGPFNGTLPVPTGMVIGYLRDPNTMPFIKYTQMVAAPDIVFSYFKVQPDDSVRLTNLNDFAWAYDDYRPSGRAFTIQGEFVDTRVNRWDFPYQIGETTRRVWKNGSGIDPKLLYEEYRATHAALHRAKRVIDGLEAASWGNNSADPYELLGLADPVYFENSSGTELLASGNPNPNFQLIKKTFQRVKRRMNLATNAAVKGNEMIAVISPDVAIAIAESGEMVNYLKQSPYAKELTDPNIEGWNLPPSYAGFKLVVDDTPIVYINQQADGTVADVTVPDERDYLFPQKTIYFLSRPGGLDGVAGGRSFSTVQCWHYGGEARVEAFTEPKHELMEGHIVMEDKVIVPTTLGGFQLTNVLES